MVYARYGLLIVVPFLTYAHNLPLAVWLGQGILGLVAITGIVVVFYLVIGGRHASLIHQAFTSTCTQRQTLSTDSIQAATTACRPCS